MKITAKVYTLALVVGLYSFLPACEQRAETTNEAEEMNMDRPEVETEVNNEMGETAHEVHEFNTWVSQNSSRAETATEAEWQEIKTEYKRRKAELEAKSADWDEETKQEWEEVKNSWNTVENKAQSRINRIGDKE